ncbi:DUF4297 domain-containing protein [Chitinibacter bivalviorum]|uniref:DUF4297 domain-containing protein n=1 Tax=Chitinibacter bivalviorum TaxID=2739434 RepID=A0A7H9BM97_9NEIS|nr:DUF4297 domain-containing protein [Chitinibacter bivalviorum]QLG89572.1 DUF4297 domain-containing protein [Chitinibacter bivalviorum]
MDTTKESPRSNPLATAQRETAGAQTFEKYEYQYHWALCRILGAHENSNDYVVFIELHEDVVLATSTDESVAQFEFNQIKNVGTPPWSKKKLTSLPKATAKKVTNSILGKMLQGIREKPFVDKLKSLDLVATCGFNLATKTDGLKLSIISIGDLHNDCLNDIQTAINKELGIYPIPKTLRFITPDLPASGFQDVAIGRISKLVDVTAPGTKCNASTIYRVLIDDLHRKGSVAFDFTEWNDLVKNKGTTHSDVERVISSYTESKGIDAFSQDLDDILNDFELKSNKRIQVRRAFERYHNVVRLERTLIAIDNQQAVKDAVERNFESFEDQGVKEFMVQALASLPESTQKNFANLESIQAAIIYELLSKCHEK